MLERVHPPRYVDALAEISAAGGGQLDLDTAMSAGSFDAALHAAGGAVRLAELLVAGEVPTGFSAHRPPGHHAPAVAGDGLLPVQQRRRRGGPRGRRRSGLSG